jgi:hypothetical protein
MEPSAHSPAQHVYWLLQQVVGSLVGNCYPCLVRLPLHGKPHNKHKASISTPSYVNKTLNKNTATEQVDTTQCNLTRSKEWVITWGMCFWYIKVLNINSFPFELEIKSAVKDDYDYRDLQPNVLLEKLHKEICLLRLQLSGIWCHVILVENYTESYTRRI